MSKLSKCLITVLSLTILMGLLSPIPAHVEAEPSMVSITSTTKSSITFEVRLSLEDLVVKTTQTQNGTYTDLHLPGLANMSQPGAPQLPYLTQVLGVPFDSEIRVEVIPGKTIRQRISAPVLPATSESVEWNPDIFAEGLWGEPLITNSVDPDPEIYASNSFFPSELSSIANDSVLRSQRLVSIALYPIQYDPNSGELIMYDQLTVKVEFSGVDNAIQSSPRAEPPAFEQLFQDNILNYEQAKGWRETESVDLVDGLSAAQTLWAPPDPGWRIKVRETGFYRITFPELLAAAVPIDTIDINTLKIFHLGEEIALKIIPGEAVVFYGELIDSKYTSENVYWLTYGGDPGLRMQAIDGSPTGGLIPLSFSEKEHFEQDELYRSQVPGDDDLDRFMWGFVYRNNSSVSPWDFSFGLQERYSGGLLMRISLIGYLQTLSINPDHHAAILINGIQVAEATWDGFSPLVVDIEIPQELLLVGNNALQVTALPTDNSQDLFFVDWVDIEYQRTFASKLGRLDYSYQTPGDWQFELTNFASAGIDVFDVTSASTPKWIENVQVSGSDGIFSAIFQDQVPVGKEYVALERNRYLSVDTIEEDVPSSLFSLANGADYLIISHHDFLELALPLTAQKIAQGLRTEIIDVQDIYDEFGYGIVDVYAIRNFIAFAYSNWAQPAPSYVLLIGDGNFDPKNNLGFERPSFIPPFLANCDPKIGETSADNRYVSIIGNDELPDLMLGRLSVNTVSEAQSIINKIIAYETNPPEGDWKSQILAVTDNLDLPPEPPAHYPLISESLLQDYFPSAPFVATKVYWLWTHNVLSEARAAIQNAFNEGRFLVSYIGHGYYSGWAAEGLFTTDDIANLQPQAKLPVILAMTCLEGYYAAPYPDSYGWEAMGEVITRTEGKGAVASWSPTGWGSVYGHDALDRGFFRAVYQDGVSVLSDATNSGLLNLWATGENLDLMDTFLLFGDPAMKLHLRLTAVSDKYSATEDEVLVVPANQGVLVNDINPENYDLAAILVSYALFGSVDLHEDGSFSYTPNSDFYGSDSFSYKVNNGIVDSNTVAVQINVNPVNDPPVAHDQTVATIIDTPVEIELKATDDESGGSSYSQKILSGSSASVQPVNAGLVFEILTQPAHGVITGDVPYIVYTPELSFVGVDQLTFKVNDGQFNSNTATVTIYVNLFYSSFLPQVSKP